MKLAVAIVSYNTRDLLDRCLESVVGAVNGLEAEIIVVDNDSPDCSADMVAARYPNVRLVRAGANLGYARANNLAAAETTAEYVVFLNPDTEVRTDTFRILLTRAEQVPHLGAAGGRARLSDGSIQNETCGRFFTFREWLLTRAGFRLIFPNRSIFAGRSTAVSGPVDWVSGVCMLIKTETLRAHHGFCEEMFAYLEDMDLCLRLRRSGLVCRHVVESEFIHRLGASFRTMLPAQERSYLASELLYVRYNWSLPERLVYRAFVTSRELVKLPVALLAGRRNVADRSRWLLKQLFVQSRDQSSTRRQAPGR